MNVIRIIRLSNPTKFPHALDDRRLLELALIKAERSRQLTHEEKLLITHMITWNRARLEAYVKN